MEQATTVIAQEAASAHAQKERELVDDVARAALEVRRVNNRLRGFNAGVRATRELMGPATAFHDAVERLAAFRGLQ